MAKSSTSSASRPLLPDALNLTGRTVVITGAASGIGRAAVDVIASLGADLILSDMAELAEPQAAAEKAGVKVRTLQGDLTEDGMIDKLVAMGPIHGLAHCAGILPRSSLKRGGDVKKRFLRTMDVNVLLPLELGLALTDHMATHGGGNIVLIGSVAGRTGGTSTQTPVDYSVSKGAVHTAIRWLSRNAVGKNVLINGIAPGPIVTPMTHGSTIDAKSLPRGRMGRADEIAWMIAMLLTPAASYVSGAVLDVNGGSYVG